MNSRKTQDGTLIFKRALLGGKIVVRTECCPGTITVLQDENGADLAGYESFFYEKKSIERIQIEFDQKPIDLAEVIRIGFNDVISPTLSIQEYLVANGFSVEEIPELITTYELDKVSYLPCAHLPIGPQRIVLLLAALRSTRPALVLRDPFMPFSGRWREHFAKLLLENSKESSRVIVCTNLSFVPQTWSQGHSMNYLDVGHAAEALRIQYRCEQEAKTREQQERPPRREGAAPNPQPVAASKEQLPPTENRSTTAQGSESQTPPAYYLTSAYREARDRIFTPLKEFSQFMRSYSAIVVVGCMAVLLATMGIAFSPDLGKYQEKMRAMARNPGDIFHALFSSETPSAPLPVEPTTGREQVVESISDHNQSQTAPESPLLNPEYETLLPTGVDELLASGETPLLSYLAESTLVEESKPPSCQ